MESLMVSGAMVAKELRHEKRKAICFEPKIEDMQVGDDIIFPRLRVEHSYSGELKFGAKFGFFRQVCTNGLSVAHGQQMESKTKNTKNSSIQFELGKTLHSFLKKAETMKDAYSPLLGEYVEFEDLTIEKIIHHSKAPKSLLAASIETFNREATMGMERNMWLAYNSINFQLNHNYTSLNMQEWNRNKLDSQLLQTCLGLCKGTSN